MDADVLDRASTPEPTGFDKRRSLTLTPALSRKRERE
jgi:hypothetical protein